jgi:hypothetical protein
MLHCFSACGAMSQGHPDGTSTNPRRPRYGPNVAFPFERLFTAIEQVEIETLIDVADGLRTPHTVAELIEGRSESHDGHFTRHDRDDSATDPRLGR